ncbi:MAG: aminotransferase class I/II-fold pyridoxal phosphate-dependent enzyme [Gammaproteobacteria bacterium]|nr:aminotransferase class I/II-fold pyridoxal phosphate-dependent enzyme [Gammaproteobacteria bacterium]
MTLKHQFFNDYSEGAHPRILEALIKTNLQQEPGYGEDSFCEQAITLIKQKIANPAAMVHFFSGGTQANLVMLASLLKPYEAVIAAKTGHIYIYETGAIEATGHKVITLESSDGKITPEQIKAVLTEHNTYHMVKPRVVYISQTTELGTLYSKHELTAISECCKQHDLYLYLDGARLGFALTAQLADLTLADISRLTDVFFIGGTKNGALLGEAIIINNPQLQENFRYHMKQRGALLAKGRLLGIQFLELFRDELYFDLARHANLMADILISGIQTCGYRFVVAPTSNLLLPILPNDIIEKLQTMYGFFIRYKISPTESVIRLITSWATPETAVTEFVQDLKKLAH